MPQVLLNFNLASDLLLDFRFNDFGFIKSLESKDVPWLAFGSHHVYAPEFAFSERSTYLKVMEGPFTSRTDSEND